MPASSQRSTALLHVLGLSVGCASAAVIVRALLLPFEFLLSRQAGALAAEGGFIWYLGRTVVWAIVAAALGAIVAVVHNEFVRRRL